jgi:hypothetical protein
MTKYITLPTEFAGYGSQKTFYFTQVDRSGDVALYKKVDTEDKTELYETILIKRGEDRVYPNGSFVPAKEYYPSDEQFGKMGWAYRTYKEALIKYNMLLNGRL